MQQSDWEIAALGSHLSSQAPSVREDKTRAGA